MIYKTKAFAAQLKKTTLCDRDLIDAVVELNSGLVDAEIGGCVFKKRIAARNKGKRRGYRVIVAAQIDKRCFFLYVFSKHKKSNISDKERLALKELAKVLLSLDSEKINKLILNKELLEVVNDE